MLEFFVYFFFIKSRDVEKKTSVLEYYIFKSYSTGGIIHYFSYSQK